MSQREFTLKSGATGATLSAQLTDSAGALDVTGWTITITVRRGRDAPVIDNQPCTVNGGGAIEFIFAEHANIPADNYNVEFKGIDPSGGVHYFPSHKTEPYGLLIVKANLEAEVE